jgi:hypothetical protein
MSCRGDAAFVDAGWEYRAFVIPLLVLAAGLGIANGPASSGSTSAVPPDQVGQASGISNMARYIGGSLAVAIIAAVYSSVSTDRVEHGASQSEALAAALSRSSLSLAIFSALGVLLVVLLGRLQQRRPQAVDLAAAAAASTHTIYTRPIDPTSNGGGATTAAPLPTPPTGLS